MPIIQTNQILMNKPAGIILLSSFLLLLGCAGCTSKKATALDLRSEEDLSGLVISCGKGNYYERKYSSREDVTVFATNSEADAVEALLEGFSDVYVADEVALSQEKLSQLGMKLAFKGSDVFDVSFALKKGNDELREALDSFLVTAPIEEIIAHWLSGAPEPPFSTEGVNPDAPPLQCVTGVNIEPVCYVGEGGQWTGLDADILRRFAASLGRPAEFSFMDIGAGIMALQTGGADIMGAFLFATPERKLQVDFSNPYYKCRPGYFIKDPDASGKLSLKERLRGSLITEGRWKLIADGLLETLKITLLSILLGTVLGAGVCAAKRSRRKWIRKAADLYCSFIAGIPTLVLLLILFYVVFSGTGLNASIVAVICFSLCFASSSGNIFNTAVSSIPSGQTEAGLSLGFTRMQTFAGIVFPQALRRALPLYSGECVSLLKNTSIVGYIAISDLTRASDLIRSRTFDALVPLLIVTILYFVFAWAIRALLKLLISKKV